MLTRARCAAAPAASLCSGHCYPAATSHKELCLSGHTWGIPPFRGGTSARGELDYSFVQRSQEYLAGMMLACSHSGFPLAMALGFYRLSCSAEPLVFANMQNICNVHFSCWHESPAVSRENLLPDQARSYCRGNWLGDMTTRKWFSVVQL